MKLKLLNVESVELQIIFLIKIILIFSLNLLDNLSHFRLISKI